MSAESENFMAVFHICLDDSGKYENLNCDYTALCGYVAHSSEWNRISLEWQNACLRWQVPYIHMAPIMYPDRSRDDRWKRIRDEWGDSWEIRRDLMLRDFGKVILASQVVCVGAVVDVAHFRTLPDSSFKRAVHDDPLYLAFHQAVMRGIEKTEVIDKHSPIGILIDDDFGSSVSCYKMLDTLKTTFPKVKDRISIISFGNDMKYPSLQAADMLSYESRRLMVERKKDPDYPISELWESLTLLGINQPIFYSPDYLDRLSARSLYEGSASDEVTLGIG